MVLQTQKLRTPLVGAQGYQRFPLFEPGVRIQPWLHNMLCLLLGSLAYSFLPSQFILLHFLRNDSQQRLQNVWNCEKTLTRVIR